MNKSTLLLFLFVFFLKLGSAQDLISGTWIGKHSETNEILPFEVTLEIGIGEKEMLYPLRFTIKNETYEGVFQCIALKKSARSFSISTAKYVTYSSPFNIGSLTPFFTGLLNIQRNNKGENTLDFERFSYPKSMLISEKMDSVSAKDKPNHQKLRTFLLSTPIRFIKKNESPWSHPDADSLLQPRYSPLYIGIMDTLFVNTKKLDLKIKINKDNDIVSSRLSQNPVWDQVDSKKEREDEIVVLDTGLNILGFFADDFGKTGYSSASMEIGMENFSRILNFGVKENQGFTFIAQKIYYRQKEEDITSFDEISIEEKKPGNKSTFSKTKGGKENLNEKQIKTIGTLKSRSNKLKFAIWDDAVEDGDTISIMVNDNWIASGLPVKKKPTFIEVSLQPGSNSIVFQADNLGSIVPNTSVVEIIDGKKRKSYFIETDLDHMNRINIIFDVPK
jgi:hypothetical protein